MIIEFLTGLFNSLLEIFQSGGIITYIIVLIGIYGLLTSIQKIRYLRSISKSDTTEIMGTVIEAMNRGGAIEALKSISHYKNPVSKIISEALKIGYKNKTEVEEGMEQVFIVELSKMTKGLNTLKTIIELAPFLGLIGTVIGIWMTFRTLGVQASSSAMAEGIYIALITTIVGLATAIILLPIQTYIKSLISTEMDKIELANKMTNWSYAVAKIKVSENVPCALEALKEAEGIVNTREIIGDDITQSNIQISFKPSMLEKSINNIILEKCDIKSEITESKLKQ
ncbi:biopolymer transporter ExbB [Methanobrevibacter arboriphilus]|jgi:biopolymer transport protein ExbB|uniref:Biopolymer transporter ExbB n=1 Tax=Methanobrevibacter arboriphilus TaxID=39441 RepID=A0ACA8R5Q3_METAZ|nr:MotA/TolQ/ExbB proton channel family protein [Methanobrevibacter arboriphilus]MCC7561726.1 MotA/TolQ/ExbB proton channel family protein [Methanobrevibacter arboriphilus]BBL62657.1 biopolymer transporter ExbB [Methanobrevibacter arboriphilus]GLI11896.1 biopolymer transporter ExbB [Methanobrevibacter arboriphilus]